MTPQDASIAHHATPEDTPPWPHLPPPHSSVIATRAPLALSPPTTAASFLMCSWLSRPVASSADSKPAMSVREAMPTLHAQPPRRLTRISAEGFPAPPNVCAREVGNRTHAIGGVV
eukprot:COSAG01_NODE_3280_length_6312_cov_45.174823_4_plen_116_part_00